MFKGVGTALITPFNSDLSVDYKSLKKIVEHQIANKIDALIVLGTTGESPVIDNDEREKILETVLEVNQNRVPTILGTGSNNTKHVAEQNNLAEKYKVDGVLIVNPYYNKGTQQSLVEHYKYISERTSLKIILYNVPSRTGMNILPETAVKIHDVCKNIVAIKEASGNISQIAHLISIKPDSLDVLSGNDDQTLPIMALGGVGVISVFSNPFPKQMKEIVDALLKNDLITAQKFDNKYLAMMNKLFLETSPSPVKYVMSKLNLCKNFLRLPLIKTTQSVEAILDKELLNYQ